MMKILIATAICVLLGMLNGCASKTMYEEVEDTIIDLKPDGTLSDFLKK